MLLSHCVKVVLRGHTNYTWLVDTKPVHGLSIQT